MKWEKILGEEWHKLLSSFVESEKMPEIIKSVKIARKNSVIYPEKHEFHKMFRIFTDLQPSEIKVIILLQDPFPNGNGTGYALDNADILPGNINPSLKNFLEEIKNNDVEKDESPFVDSMDLGRLVKQGVFLINSYLTVQKGNPGEHMFWSSFTKYWIKALSEDRTELVWLLMGSFAQGYERYIACIDTYINSPYIIRTSHPSPFSYTTETKKAVSFKGSRCFVKINNYLWVNNKETIKW